MLLRQIINNTRANVETERNDASTQADFSAVASSDSILCAPYWHFAKLL